MSTLIDNPEFSANEVYQIAQTDPVEGAAAGASFGGIGVSNQPHQQLANRTAFIKGRQDTNIANIGLLQAFTALFSGSMGANGYITIPFADINRGQIELILQWGFYSFAGLTPAGVQNAVFSVSLPLTFSNAGEWAAACYTSNNPAGRGALVNAGLALEPITPLGKSALSFFSDWNGAGSIAIAGGTKTGLTGFFWAALGF